MAGGLAYGLTVAFFGTGAPVETVVTPLLMAVYVATAAWMFFCAPRSERLFVLNLAGIALDVLLLVAISLMLHAVMNPALTPFSFILKSDVYPFSILFLMFHMISFQPAVLLISGAALFGFNVALLLLSIWLGPGVTGDFGVGFTSYRVNIDFEIGKLVTFLFIAATAYYISRRNRRTIHASARAEVSAAQLGRYFSPNVSKQILRHDGDLEKVGGKLTEVAVLFSDIKNFTTLSETLRPDEVLKFLSGYHERMVAAIFAHNGSLDKFIGDAIMATFGIPESGPEDAANAVRAALAMNEALAKLNTERRQRGEFEISHRIGIHYGPVLAGNIGSAQRLEYTVIGDTVNTASRIEQACKQFGRSLLVSGAVVQKTADAFGYEPLGDIEVKGRAQPVSLYALARALTEECIR